VAIVLALAKPCDIYLIDEPSAYLDSEQRLIAAKVMKRWILSSKRSAFIVEHDFIMASYLADRVIVFEGIPARDTLATAPKGLIKGMN
jgi:ATP-binding cassette subfamily E protein 1